MRTLRRIVFLCALLSISCASDTRAAEGPGTDASALQPVAAAPLLVQKWTGKAGPEWSEYDRLMGEQKYEEASKYVEKELAKARASRNGEEQVRCLIRWVQLRTALHGYETAVRFLREQDWPDDLLGRTVIQLYYAHTLWHYAHMYSWEINKRERIESKGLVDLKAWTMEQIFAEALKTYAEVWQHRDQLGELPASHLVEYVQPNTFPDGVRPTLRDALTYLTVEMLSDSTGWRPEHSNEVYRLDLKALLGARQGVALADPEVHPLVKTAAVLDDLEAWHAGRGDREAALEARLERLRRLWAHFTEPRDREALRRDLTTRLDEAKAMPWWSSGMATLSDFTREDDDPDALIRARGIAEKGRAAFPDSVGGGRCLSIVKSIESPDFQVEAMSTDGPERRSIGVMARNLDRLYFRAYPMDLKQTIESSDDYDLLPNWQDVKKLMEGRQPSHEWSVPLPPTPDFRSHRTWVTPPMKDPGFYVVVASGRQGFGREDNRMYALPMVIGDLVLVSRTEWGSLEVSVRSGSTGKPIQGATVHLYRYDYRNRHRSWASEETGPDGLARFPEPRRNESYFLFARKDEQVAIDPNYLYFYHPGEQREHTATFLFTDRSIYRPLQKLFFKAIVYRGNPREASYKTSPGASLAVSLLDPNGQKVETKNLVTNRYGTASGEFVIPAGRLLGQWRVESSQNGMVWVRVEEYKRPTFEAKILDPENPLRLNQQATLKGEVRYYFGLPVTNGKVKWRVQRDPQYPWWWGWWWGGGPTVRSQTVASGIASLEHDGRFTVKFTPQADESLATGTSKDMTYRYTLTADVTDEGGETRSAQRGFRLGFVAVEATMGMETAFFMEGKTPELTLTRTDLDGTPAPGKGQWRVVALAKPAKTLLPAEQPVFRPAAREGDRYESPGDPMRPRWAHNYQAEQVMRGWADGQEVAKGGAEHNAKGVTSVTLPSLKQGAYRLRYETTDPFGAKYEMSKEFVVAGERMDTPLPGLFGVEKALVPVGGTARIMVVSGLEDQQVVLELYREGRRYERRVLTSGKDRNVIEIPVTEADRGGFGVVVNLLRDHQFLQFSQAVYVPWDNKQLKVEFSTFRDRMKPGQEEDWAVKVTAPKGKDATPFAAEILAYMYDRSLDAFAGHYPPSPNGVFPNRTGVTWSRASLALARQVWIECNGFTPPPGYSTPQPDRLKFPLGYGIGGPGRRGYRDGGGRMMLRSMPPPAPAAVSGRISKPGVQYDFADDTVEGEMMAREEVADKKALDQPRSRTVTAALKEKDARGGEDTEGQREPEVQMRADFSETAFWQPHLETGDDGSVTIRFKVPDSVTSWNVWVHAVTRDLKSGSLKKEAATVKDLMVRPYLPRFLREGDRADIKVVVNNASAKEMSGHVAFDIIDPATERSLLADFGLKPDGAKKMPFKVAAGGGTNLTFPIVTPARVGTIAFKVVAIAGDDSDGELRPIPVLPGRMHLAQSRFVTLKNKDRRTMTFQDLAKGGDPTLINEQMVVTLDAQLFYSVLSALPYLVNYPYECTEQTLNRFLSTGILTALYKDYPAVSRMAEEFSKRTTQFEQWDAPDPNRKMTLEETPWVVEAKGGDAKESDLVNVLDPRIAKAHRDGALAKLRKAQTSSGGFPWFPGGPPSPYMTLYLLYGFSKGLEFGADVPRDVIQRAWAYLHRHYVDEWVRVAMAHDCCWESVTFLNYVITQYPDSSWTGGVFTDAERKTMLDFSFRHWKRHAPYLKGYLALTLKRMGREKDARLVWESVMDSAKTAEDQGTFWAPEDRAWLWYNDTIETHAFAVRTVMELTPEDPKLDGLVLWLFLNKKLNHWKSTRATAEVVYSLAHYLKKIGALGVREEARVSVGGQTTEFVFEPDRYTGKKNQVVIPGEKVDAATTSTITVEKATPGYLFASATWHFSTEKMPEEDRGDYLKVSRTFFKRVTGGREVVLEPLKEGAVLKPGDEVEVHISLRSKHPMEYVHLRDPRGAGFEPDSPVSRHKWELGIYWYEEIRDSGTNFFFESLPQGEYNFKYRIRAATAGTFKVAPATVQPMYAPEFTAYSAGAVLAILGM